MIEPTNPMRPPRELEVPLDRVAELSLSPDGTLAVAREGGQLLLCDCTRLSLAWPVPWTRTGRAPEGTARLAGRLGSRARAGRDPALIGISPDNRLVGLRDGDGSIVLIEAASGAVRHTIPDRGAGHDAALFIPDSGRLAVATRRGPIHLYDIRGRHLGWPKQLDHPTCDRLWRQMLDADAAIAFVALQQLAAAPESTVPFVDATVPAAQACPPARFQAWLADLESPIFAVREAATRELKTWSDVMAAELMAARRAATGAESQRRLDAILTAQRPGSPLVIRRERIVELIEWCGTSAARDLLRRWSAGHPTAGLTQAAQAALQRVSAESPASPSPASHDRSP